MQFVVLEVEIQCSCGVLTVDYSTNDDPIFNPFQIDGLFYPGFTTITWTSLEIPAFFKELEKAFREMGLFIKTVWIIITELSLPLYLSNAF